MDTNLTVINPDENTQLSKYEPKGLSPEDSNRLEKWVESGKPGLIKYKAEHLGQIYALGYSTEEIHRWFPEYPYEVILWGKVYYSWDDLREKYRTATTDKAIEQAATSKTEAIRLLADTLSATHISWRRQLMDYLSDPKKNPIPPFLPKSLTGYHQLLTMLNEQTAPPEGSIPTTPTMVQVNVGGEKSVEVRSANAKDILAEKLKSRRGK